MDDHASPPRRARAPRALLLAGLVAVGLGLAGIPGAAPLLIAGLAVAGLGGVLTRIDGPADWWPGMRVKGL